MRHAGPDVAHLHRIAYVENRYCPDVRNCRSGAAGLYQFMPHTWEWARARAELPPSALSYDPENATIAAAWVLSQPGGSKHSLEDTMSLKAFSSPAWDPDDASLWTMEECATFLRITKFALYHKGERGEIPCERMGSRIRSIPSSVRPWIQAQEIRLGT